MPQAAYIVRDGTNIAGGVADDGREFFIAGILNQVVMILRFFPRLWNESWSKDIKVTSPTGDIN